MDRSPENGSSATRASPFFKANILWTYFAAFFPLTVHKTVELEPSFVLKTKAKAKPKDAAETESTKQPVKVKAANGGTSAVSAAAATVVEKVKEDVKDPLDSDWSNASTLASSTTTSVIGRINSLETETDGTEISDDGDTTATSTKANSPTASSNGNGQCTPSLDIIQSSTEFAKTDDGGAGSLGIYIFMKDFFFWLLSFLPIIPKSWTGANTDQYERTGKQYIFGYHPHGIIGMGAMGGIATEGANWSKMFPGVRVSLLTLINQFQIPLYREYLLALGLASVSRRSCISLLNKGQSICIVLGGAQESLVARPGTMDLILEKRKGFVKLAMAVGNTSLVPILGFGENDLYDQVQNDPSSKLFQIQTFLKNKIGFTLPLMHARGIFNYDFGIIPYRRPINIVVGHPIEVPKIEKPTEAQVLHYHGLYVEALFALFDAHKDKFHKDLTGQYPNCVYQDIKAVA